MREHVVFVADARGNHEPDEATINAAIWSYVGKRYDLMALAEFKGFGKDDPNRECCSELGRGVLRIKKYDYPPAWDQGVSPWDMQRHFEATGGVVYRCYKEFWG
jgi:hypothetical protein